MVVVEELQRGGICRAGQERTLLLRRIRQNRCAHGRRRLCERQRQWRAAAIQRGRGGGWRNSARETSGSRRAVRCYASSAPDRVLELVHLLHLFVFLCVCEFHDQRRGTTFHRLTLVKSLGVECGGLMA